MFKSITWKLVEAFLVREAQDFSHFSAAGRMQFVEYRLRKIHEALAVKQANYVTIVSVGNTGCVLRELVLSPDVKGRFNIEADSIRIVLCTCGEDDCWGAVYEE